MAGREHWEAVYTAKAEDQVSWFQERPACSLALIRATGLGPAERLVDVGGGASRLVDALLEEGCRDITVVDIAETALARA
ncbi:MAG: SAM-dependent methyltransferase, partial [Gammaproteobacteria bacterium]|nr:SAM-dependent methyltransferase [Gammaproteobacteria bacterium]